MGVGILGKLRLIVVLSFFCFLIGCSQSGTLQSGSDVESITLDPQVVYLTEINQRERVSVSFVPSGSVVELDWVVASDNICTVDEDGWIDSLSLGETRITVSVRENPLVSDVCRVFVSDPVVGVNLDQTQLNFSTFSSQTLTASFDPSGSLGFVHWQSSDATVCRVSDDGVVTAVGDGDATITATLDQDNTIQATCDVSVDVPVQGLQLDATSLVFTQVENQELSVSFVPSGSMDDVTWTSESEDVCQVSNGVVTPVSNGTTNVVVSLTDDSTIQASCSISVNVTISGIELDQETLSFSAASETVTLNATLAEGIGDDLVWRSSDEDVCTVDDDGLVTSVGSGVATVSVHLASDEDIQDTCEVTVDIPVTSLSLDQTELTFTSTASQQLSVETLPEGSIGEIAWQSLDEDVCLVSSTGVVTVVRNGSTRVVASLVTDDDIDVACDVDVSIPVDSLALSADSLTFRTVDAQTLDVVFSPTESFEEVQWSESSGESVCSVDDDGVVTPVSNGTSVLTVALVSDTDILATSSITVDVPIETLSVSPLSLRFEDISSQQVTPTLGFGSTEALEWESSDTTVCTVDDDGLVTSVGNGTANVIVTHSTDSDLRATCSVTVAIPVTGLTLDDETIEFTSFDDSQTLVVSFVPSASSDTVEWSVSDDEICSVSDSGLVRPLKNGEATVRVELTEDSDIYAECEVTVNVAVQSLSLSSDTLSFTSFSQTEQLQYRFSPDGSSVDADTLAWSSSDTDVCTVSDEGEVTAVANGTATVTVLIDGTSIDDTCEVTVDVEPTDLSLDSSTLTFTAFSNQTLEVSFVPEGSTKDVEWESSDTSVCTVSDSGEVTPVRNGSANVSVSLVSNSSVRTTCDVSVEVPVTGLSLDQNVLRFGEIESTALTVSFVPSGSMGTVGWKSSDSSICTVSSSGNVTAVQDGDAIVTVFLDSDSSIEATCSVEVDIPIQSLELNETSLRFTTLSSSDLDVDFIPDGSFGSVLWSSSDEAVCTVSSEGLVRAVSNGVATVSVSVSGNSSILAESSVEVDLTVTGIALDQDVYALETSTSTVTADVSFSPDGSDGTLVWTSSESDIFTVSDEGVLDPVSLGVATVSVQLDEDSSIRDQATVIVGSANAEWQARRGHMGLIDSQDRLYVLGGALNSDGGGDSSVWRSSDEGGTWTSISTINIHQNHVYDEREGVIEDDVIYFKWNTQFFSSTDLGATWVRDSGAAPATIKSQLAIDSEGTIYSTGGEHSTGDDQGLQCNGLWKSSDDGVTWEQVDDDDTPQDSFFHPVSQHTFMIDADDNFYVIGGVSTNYDFTMDARNDVWKSDDSGESWTQVASGTRFSSRYGHASVFDAQGNLYVLGGTSDGGTTVFDDVWKSEDEGATWTQVAGSKRFPARTHHSCVVDSNGHFYVIAGQGETGFDGDESQDSLNDIWKSTDSGVSWERVYTW